VKAPHSHPSPGLQGVENWRIKNNERGRKEIKETEKGLGTGRIE